MRNSDAEESITIYFVGGLVYFFGIMAVGEKKVTCI
jgi:hypothetical protein